MKIVREYRCAGMLTIAIVLFLGLATPGAQNAAAQESKAAGASAGNGENGKKLFNKNGCYECHGREGQGSSVAGPRIAPDPIPLDALLRYVRKPTGEMPPYTAKVISDQELADIYAFLQSRPHPPAPKDVPILK